MKSLLIFIMLACLQPVPWAIGEESEGDIPAELARLQSEFSTEMSKLDTPILELNETYRGHLEGLKERFQKIGDLKAVLAIEEELKSFEGKPNEISLLPDLKRLQEIYRKEKAIKITERSRNALPTVREFQNRAEKLVVEWTRFNRIADAKLAQAEVDKLAGLLTDSSILMTRTAIDEDSGKRNDFAGDRPGDEMRNGIGMKLCWIPPGRFTMGSPENENGRISPLEDQVEVEITYGFWMGKYEVTQEDYFGIMGANPSFWPSLSANRPVETLSWPQAEEFCKRLTEREKEKKKIPASWEYRLPSEAQWEYACRAGTTGPYYGELDDVGWFDDNRPQHTPYTSPVGEKKSNSWGLHDMHGNVWEWTDTWFVETLQDGADPMGPAAGQKKVRRGGAFWTTLDQCRAANRSDRRDLPFTASASGFRVILAPSR